MEILKVAAKSRSTAVAGAIAGVVRESGRAEVQAIGAVAANGGRPMFVSAGPDGRFGHRDPASAADNIVLLPSPR